MKMPEHCRKCKMYQSISAEGKKPSGVCLSGYKNPAQTMETALHQLDNGGEYPCSKSPIRSKMPKTVSNFMLSNKLFNIKFVQPLHFRKEEPSNEE